MKTILFLSLFITSLFAEKNIEVIPPNIQYANSTLEDFSTYLYEEFHNGIADYNYAQDTSESFLNIKENAIPVAIYSERIKRFHKEITANPLEYIERRHLTHLIVLDFVSKTTLRSIEHSQETCTIYISIKYYDKDGVLNAKTLPLYYHVVYGTFNKASRLLIKKFIVEITNK